ncbi:unnamed protein product [Rotaria sordida]|uniref:Uncharacterized protein n=1 Tax=Rotaria sordida TaxID=392033 RepID=A0A813VVK2_9BILA|nr:unnamed protein product [Rotaria sordida]CAF0985999.1 unnamed protein product [Rotaria sordida]
MNQLKRLLNSLKMNDTLYQLTYLLNPIMPFQGQWCYRGSNVTFAECNITIPISSCTQCTLSGMVNQTRTELCATCLTNSPDKTGLSHGMIFNMTERIYSTLWLLNCERENCNTPAVSGTSCNNENSIFKSIQLNINKSNLLSNLTTITASLAQDYHCDIYEQTF